jgi:hypothetical protein
LPGGAGAKLPPGANGVRPDGECDQDSNVGDTSPRTRLPTNGTWTGEPGTIDLLRPWIRRQFGDEVQNAAERLEAFRALIPGELPAG